MQTEQPSMIPGRKEVILKENCLRRTKQEENCYIIS